MKNILILIICLISLNISAQDQRPQAAISFAEVSWNSDDYEKLQKEWEKVVKKDNKDADAWKNLYMSAYYKHRTSKYYGDSIIKGSPKEQEDILERLTKAIPNTFEYNFIMYKTEQFSVKSGKYIEKAYELRPNDISTYSMLIAYYELICDTAKKEEIYKKWYANDPNIAEYKLAYAYNTLNTVEENAIILGNGDFTVYSIELFMYGKDFRKDVTVTYQSMFQNDVYYNNLLERLGMPKCKKAYKDYTIDPEYPMSTYFEINSDRIKHIIDNADGRPIYFPIGFESELFKDFEDSLYIVGTMYKYCEHSFDNIALLKRNFEHNMLLDHLKVDFKKVPESSLKYRMQIQYLQPLLELFKHYLISGDYLKSAEIKELILKLTNDYSPEIGMSYKRLLEKVEEKYSDL